MTPSTIDDAVRSLDGASTPQTVLTPRALADLHRILETPRPILAPHPERSRSRRILGLQAPRTWSRRIRLAVAMPAAAAVIVGAVALSMHQPPSAAATWTPAAEAADVDAAGVQQCVQWWTATESADALPVLQERRGITTLVLGADDRGGEILCTVVERPGQEPIGAMSSLQSVTDVRPDDRGIATLFIDTSFDSAEAQNSWTGQGTTAVSGYVGPEVQAMVIDSPAGPVEATVTGGRFAAWWPIEDDADTHPDLTAEVTLTDGSVQEVPLEER